MHIILFNPTVLRLITGIRHFGQLSSVCSLKVKSAHRISSPAV